MNSVLQSISNIPALRKYFISDLLPAGKSVPLGKQMVTRTDTIDCLRSVHDKTLMKTLEEEEMYELIGHYVVLHTNIISKDQFA